MVKIGFICEGKTEVMLLSSDSFNNYLESIGLEPVNIINAETQGNLLPHNITSFIEALTNQGAKHIVILTDLDKDACITLTRQRIKPRPQDIFTVAVKEIEAWFLANTAGMCLLLDSPDFTFQFPEKEEEPFIAINQLLVKHKGRGIGSNSKRTGGKVKLIKRLIDNGFRIEDSAAHLNCPSVKYFIKKLSSIN